MTPQVFQGIRWRQLLTKHIRQVKVVYTTLVCEQNRAVAFVGLTEGPFLMHQSYVMFKACCIMSHGVLISLHTNYPSIAHRFGATTEKQVKMWLSNYGAQALISVQLLLPVWYLL